MTNLLFDALFGVHAGSQARFIETPDGRTIRYAEFLALVAQFANVIRDRGLEPGDRVAAQVHKSVEALALYGACVQSGAVFLPLNTGYTADELGYFVSDSGAALLVGDPAAAPRLAPLAADLGAQFLTLGGDGGGSFAQEAAGKPRQADIAPRSRDDLASLLYTSGTTGRSKGAMLTQGNLLSNAQALVEHWRFTSEDTLLHALPIFHTHGLFVACNVTLQVGGALVYLPTFDLDDVFRLMPKCTAMMGVPTFYTRLLSDPRLTAEATGNMRVFISGSAPLLAETHVSFAQRTGHTILERYGMTETNMNTSNPYSGERRAGTVGQPLPGTEVIITDPDTGQERSAGEIGSIEVRGENVFQGYWNMPEKTAEELRANGFFITGDLGKFDADGYLHIVGRSKDLIISGGYNIYPKEVELVLDEVPGVVESAVVGVPHADFGEGVLAVLVQGEQGAIDLDAVQDAVSGQLAKFKHPKRYVLISGLPRNTMGKVQKNVLRDTYATEFQL